MGSHATATPASAAAAPALPAWVNSRMAIKGWALLSLSLVLLAAGFLGLDYRQIRQTEQLHNGLLARSLENQTELSLNTTALALQGLAHRLEAAEPAAPSGEALERLLGQTLDSLPFVRSFSLLDEGGRVLASSHAGNRGLRLDLARLGRGGPGLGPPLRGRDLDELDRTTPAPSLRYLVPYSLPLRSAAGQRHLVAVLNPDFFANLFERQLDGEQVHAALFNMDGSLIAASAALSLPPAGRWPAHPVFSDFGPEQERGSYAGQGLNAQPVLGSFQRVRNHPWLLLVELPQRQLWLRLQASARVVGLSTLAGLILMTVLAAMAWRALAAYDLARRALEQAHRDLAAKEQEQSLLIHKVQELMFRTDAAGRLQFVNHAHLLGQRSAAELLGLDFEQLVDARDQARLRQLFRSSAGGQSLPLSLRMAAGSGPPRVMELSLTALHAPSSETRADTQPSPTGFVGFAIDVTEREDARQRLQAQLDFTARLIDVCPIPIYAKDLKLRFVMVNQAWCEMSGFSQVQALGRRLSELGPADQADQAGPVEALEALDKRLLQHGGSEQLELHERGRDLLTQRSVFTDAQGRVAGLLGSAIDISRFVDAERLTREAREAAERSERVKTEFLSRIGSELRAPLLSLIEGSERGLQAAAQSARHAQQKEQFARIHAAGQRMLGLVHQLLDLARQPLPPARAEGGTPRSQDLAPLLIGLVRDLQPLAAGLGQTLQLQLPPQALPAAVDPPRLLQALRHLLEYGLRQGGAGQVLRLEVHLQEPGLTMTVHMPGLNLDAQALATLFELGAEPGAESAPDDGQAACVHLGLNLGLALCRKLLREQGGAICAHSQLPGGSLFELRLPRA